MSRREVARKNPGHVFAQTEFEQLRASYQHPSYELRANYAATLDRLDAVFDPEGERMSLQDPEEWEELLFERFPDAPDRLFTEFGLVMDEE